MFIHREPTAEHDHVDEVRDTSLLIEKHRNGPTGEIPLRFHGRYVTYMSADDDRSPMDLSPPVESVDAEIAEPEKVSK